MQTWADGRSCKTGYSIFQISGKRLPRKFRMPSAISPLYSAFISWPAAIHRPQNLRAGWIPSLLHVSPFLPRKKKTKSSSINFSLIDPGPHREICVEYVNLNMGILYMLHVSLGLLMLKLTSVRVGDRLSGFIPRISTLKFLILTSTLYI